MKEKICDCVAEVLEKFCGGKEVAEVGLGAESMEKDTKTGSLMKKVSTEEIMELMEGPPEEAMGDFALPCFALAKVLRKSPKVIAEELAEVLIMTDKEMLEKKGKVQKEEKLVWKEKIGVEKSDIEKLGIEKVVAVNGYLNFYMDRKLYVEHCLEQLEQSDLGVEKAGEGRTVCMDYSSPNIAKNFHVGHLRTTVIGNSLAKIYKQLGWNVVRINYLGDWGTQFGKLIVAYKKWSSKEAVEEKGIEELLRIYVKFNAEAEADSNLIAEARSWFVRMEQKDEEAIAIWKWFLEISMKEFERVYRLLDVEFDSYTGESFYRDKVPGLVEELTEKGLLTESQGAYVIDLQEYDMPPCLILKSDGGSIYHSRDIAALLHRKETYHFDKCLYVTGLEQALHFKQVFQSIEVMGYDWKERLVHVPYGLVSLEGEKLSTRTGNIIYAEDILKEAIRRAFASIEEKNPDLKDKERVAEMVGVGAVIFHDLYHQRIKNVDFSWEEVLSFEGATGPYVQYTYARAKSILRKSSAENAEGSVREDIAPYLTEDASYHLLKELMGYGDAVKKAAEKYEPSVLARYAITVAAAFNRFYHESPILSAKEEVKEARLKLVELTCRVLEEVCGLLGIKCPEEM